MTSVTYPTDINIQRRPVSNWAAPLLRLVGLAATLGLCVFMSMLVTQPAAAQPKENICPPDLIPEEFDNVIYCAEVIIIDEDAPKQNPKLYLPDSRGGGVPTNNGYVPKARDRNITAKRRHGPTNPDAKVKAQAKLTEKMFHDCVNPINTDPISLPFFTTPEEKGGQYMCAYVKTSIDGGYKVWERQLYDSQGTLKQECNRPVTQAEGGPAVPPGVRLSWYCANS
jgi:hypothetical protein